MPNRCATPIRKGSAKEPRPERGLGRAGKPGPPTGPDEPGTIGRFIHRITLTGSIQRTFQVPQAGSNVRPRAERRSACARSPASRSPALRRSPWPRLKNSSVTPPPRARSRCHCTLIKLLFFLEKVVPGGGIEPPTRGFSILCSTPELPGLNGVIAPARMLV